MDARDLARIEDHIRQAMPRAVKTLPAVEGRIDPAILLGLDAAAEDDLASRPSHHDAVDGAHEHDDFESFVVDIPAASDPAALIARLQQAADAHDVLRMKGFAPIRAKPLRLSVQGVGARFRHHFDKPWPADSERAGQLVVIGRSGLDRAAITQAIAG
jgi:cobalamin biosynthesis protein CobW